MSALISVAIIRRSTPPSFDAAKRELGKINLITYTILQSASITKHQAKRGNREKISCFVKSSRDDW